VDAAEVLEHAAHGESFTVEFKGEAQNKLSDRDLVEAAVCLANGRGGILLVGVEDNGRITGARPRHEGGRTDPARVQALIANQTVPPVLTTIALVPVEDLTVLVIEVEDNPRVVGTSRGLYVRRALRTDGHPECVPFPAHEMLTREINRGALDYARLPVPGATWEDLDPLQFERLRILIKRAGPGGDPVLAELSDIDIAKALGVLDESAGSAVPLTGALLLFGRAEALRRHIPTHEAAFQVLTGSTVLVNDFLRHPLFQLADELYERLMARNEEQELDAGLLRIALPRLPEAVVREIVANALVHRDFTMMGAIQVQLTGEALVVASPGGFPEGVRLDNLLTVSRPRSPILADAFKRAGVVERTGRGVNRMFEILLRIGREAPDYTRSTEQGVVAVIGLSDSDLPLARLFLERERASGTPYRLSDLQIVHELKREGASSTEELADVLQETPTQARAVLARLQEQGLIDARGAGRGRSWHLSAAVYRSLDEASSYPRIRGFDRIQQQQMILSYVTAHGRITRREAAELGSMTPIQATKTLKQLTDSGQLALHGERRWAYYTAADQAGQT
jgi:ATP-dependent DNA helicase RecG